ncbi:MAG TPA: hypothetical protein VMI52_07680 [Acetobacteraceae bacterium]|nr:hypothetical protein [Acetobacteraceae bacterium]
MTASIPFRSVFHADWSTTTKKRWVASALRMESGWQVEAPRLVTDTRAFIDGLFMVPGPVIAGFDFPVGVPAAYGRQTGLKNFLSALDVFGKDEWAEFFMVADTPEQVSLRRPFYPRVSTAASKQINLLRGLGVESFDALRRDCERATATRRPACPLFWTLGGNQVGKAAISGWQEVIAPARRCGALLWPFDGSLVELAKAGRPVIAETYPAEAYGHVGIAFRANMSKQRQEDRRAAMADLFDWAHRRGVTFSADAAAQINDGFGVRKAGEDPFDALAGLLGMVEVLDGYRPEGPVDTSNLNIWEGWILGQAP